MSERHNQNGASRDIGHFPDELLAAYALGQLEGAERDEIERLLADPAQQEARQMVAQTQRLADALPVALADIHNEPVAASSALRAAINERLKMGVVEKAEIPATPRRRRLPIVEVGVAVSLCLLLATFLLPRLQSVRETAQRKAAANGVTTGRIELPSNNPTAVEEITVYTEEGQHGHDTPLATLSQPASADSAQPWFEQEVAKHSNRLTTELSQSFDAAPIQAELQKFGDETAPQNDLLAKTGTFSGSGISGRGARIDLGPVPLAGGGPVGGAQPSDPYVARPTTPNNGQQTYEHYYHDPKVPAKNPMTGESIIGMQVTPRIIVREEEEDRLALVAEGQKGREWDRVRGREGQGSEQYEPIYENPFLGSRPSPLSTFSIDVDTASYANMRRFLTGGSLPPPDAVRIEELVNYFRYDYPQPKGPEPFSVNMEVAECPWNNGHLLLRVGLKGKEVHRGERPASNLVFLLDVSGSMADENKLPLLKTAMQMFAAELGENDRVSIVTYAGEAGLRLPPTRGHEYEKIRTAIESLSSGGSTNGSAGIELAYEQAKAYFVEGGTNRVILCTDGDLNVGITDDEALVQLIKQKAGGGTFLTVLGFGEGNLKDAKMEKLADNGNGLYAYIDSVREARKVLVEQMTGSTITIAKDVKIQIEFNPAVIASYRLLGYENRVLAAQDFNDDQKDAGEIGAGHTVTALYELVPVGAQAAVKPQPGVEPLKYQAAGGQKSEVRGQEETPLTDAAKSGELLTLKLRYKEPEGQASKLLEVPLKDRGGRFNKASKDLQFAAAVASFGMILRGSEHRGSGNLEAVEEIASGSIGEDAGGYRAEFVDLVRKAHTLGAR